MIYLDHNATTPLAPASLQALQTALEADYANPASQHAAGRRAMAQLHAIRARVREQLTPGVDTGHDRVIFTSGGTEANNLAIRGLAGQTPGRVIISALEHPCIRGAAEALGRDGFEIIELAAGADGRIDLDALQKALTDDTRLVSVMHANHETGVLQPVVEAAERCAKRGVPFHTDAVQSLGKVPLSFRELGVSAMTLSAHKFHGPRGIGALLVRDRVELHPILFGGGQQLEMRPGTESVALPVALEAALAWSLETLPPRAGEMAAQRDEFERLVQEGVSELVINGGDAPRLPNTSSLAFPGVDRQALLMALDQQGVACSTGSACASGSSEPSPVLLGMGCDPAIVDSSLRFSFGLKNRPGEAREAAEIVVQIVKKLRD